MRFLTLLILPLLLLACSDSTTDAPASGPRVIGTAEAPDINIKVEGATPGWAYLIGVYAEQQYKLDSAQVDANGNIHLIQNEPYQQGFAFLQLPGRKSLQILITEDQTFTMTTVFSDLLANMEIEGSLDNELLYRNLLFERTQRTQFDRIASMLPTKAEGSPEHTDLLNQKEQLLAERAAHLNELFTDYPNSFFTIFKRAGQNPEVRDIRNPNGSVNTAAQVYHYRMDFWDGVDFADNRLIYTPVISNKLRRYINELTPQHPDSILASSYYLMDQVPEGTECYKYFANWIVTNYDPKETTLMDPQAVYANMIQKYFTYEKAFWSDSVTIYSLQQRAFEMAASLIGKKAPDVTANDPNGQPKTLYDLTAPYLIVYMYNPTCEHCAVETPKLVQFYQEWKSKGVDVFGIAIDTDQQEWKDYIASSGMQWTNVFDPTNKAIYAKYFVDVTPEIYVLNPDRIIIGKNLKVEQIQTVITQDQAKRNQ